jgi:hypothetical protein
MADFGLAAQIGRGGGGGNAMAQPVDPMNRMTQLMQLQQLQQNMMLAREQEAREAALAPLRRQNLEREIEAGGGRINLLREQTGQAAATRQQAERTERAEVAALDYIAKTPPELRADPARLDALRKSNPGAYNFMTETIAKARALQEKARAEGFSADRAQFEFQKTALSGMSSLLPAVSERTWPAIYDDYRKIDPVGARVIGPDFTPENVAALRARIQDRADLRFETDPQGFEYIVNTRDGSKTPVVKRGVNPPATSQFGALDMGARINTPQMIGQGAAGLVSPAAMEPSGAAPIIQPRAVAPETAGAAPMAAAPAPTAAASPGPRAAAEAEKTRATETAKAEVVSEDRRRGAGEVLKALNDAKIEDLITKSTSGIVQRTLAGVPGAFGVATSGMERIGQLATIESQIITQILGGKLGGGISDADVKLVKAGVADIANPDIPANQRLAAFRQLKNNLSALASGKEIAVATPTRGAAEKNAVDTNNPFLR